MKRRGYLTGLASAAAVGLAGCGGDGSSAQQGSDGTSTSATTTAAPASFELVSVDAPEKVEIGEEVTYGFTVKNTGGESGTFETMISSKQSAASTWSTSGPWEQEVAAGEEYTLKSQPFTLDYLQTVDFRIDAFDETFSITAVSKKLPIGSTYTTPGDIQLTVSDISAKTNYTYSSSGFEYTQEPKNGKFLFVTFHAKNTSGQPEFLPLQSDVSLLYDSSQYDAQIYYGDGGYEGGKVQAGVVREGVLVYDVPGGVPADQAEIAWSDTTYSGDVAAYWSGSYE